MLRSNINYWLMESTNFTPELSNLKKIGKKKIRTLEGSEASGITATINIKPSPAWLD